MLEQENYRTLALLSEWKPAAPPEERDGTSSEHRLLVRQARGNWEQVYLKLEKREGDEWAVGDKRVGLHGGDIVEHGE